LNYGGGAAILVAHIRLPLIAQAVVKVLALAGCTLDDVCKVTVWLDDARDFGSFNRVYLEQFPSAKPARATTEARRGAQALPRRQPEQAHSLTSIALRDALCGGTLPRAADSGAREP
jgi:enamine deaminase RidA (YjgF/YER057c/UK114 family)